MVRSIKIVLKRSKSESAYCTRNHLDYCNSFFGLFWLEQACAGRSHSPYHSLSPCSPWPFVSGRTQRKSSRNSATRISSVMRSLCSRQRDSRPSKRNIILSRCGIRLCGLRARGNINQKFVCLFFHMRVVCRLTFSIRV